MKLYILKLSEGKNVKLVISAGELRLNNSRLLFLNLQAMNVKKR